MTQRPEKKSETIEVRVSFSEKQAFMGASKETGTTASTAIRTHISEAVDTIKQRQKRLRQASVFGGVLLLLAGVGAWGAYHAPPTALSYAAGVIDYFDQNHDGRIDKSDIALIDDSEQKPLRWLIEQSDQDQDGAMSLAEFERLSTVLVDFRGTAKAASLRDARLQEPSQKVLVMSDNLSPEERMAILNKHAGASGLNAEELKRLSAILAALMPVDGGHPASQ